MVYMRMQPSSRSPTLLDLTIQIQNSPPDEEGKYLKKNAKRNIAKYKEDSYSVKRYLQQFKWLLQIIHNAFRKRWSKPKKWFAY